MNARPPRPHPGLPPIAYIDNAPVTPGSPIRTFGTPAPVILIRRGEKGYEPIYTTQSADQLNAAEGVSVAQREAMLAGAIFGWGAPAADPDLWSNGP